MRYEVLKPFQGERPYRVGEVVDATGWRTVSSLVAQRYIREVHGASDDDVPARRRQAGRQ